MDFHGIWIGLFAFFVINFFQPIVIKIEYYFTSKVWPIFLVSGIIFFLLSIFIGNITTSSFFGILSFTCFWSIKELKEQKIHVKRGWFPKNPKMVRE